MWLLALCSAGAFAFDHDHTAFSNFLDGAVHANGAVDYGKLQTRVGQLDAYLGTLATVDASGLTTDQQLALYVNAYNGYTVKTILTEKPASIRDLDGGKVWSTRKFPVAGEQLTLDDMEHGRARKIADGRIHAVVNCASKGCPPLPAHALRASSVQADLSEAASRWTTINAVVVKDGSIEISKIFDWYSEDFLPAKTDLPGLEGKQEAAVLFLKKYGDKELAAALDAITSQDQVGWMAYDWRLNGS